MSTQELADTRSADASATTTEGMAPTRRKRLRGEMPFILQVTALVLVVKAAVLTYAALVRNTAGFRMETAADMFGFWDMWDAHNYLTIAERGYVTTGTDALFIVHYPGYPLLVAAFNVLLPGGVMLAAFVASGVASVAAVLALAYLVRVDGGDRAKALRAAWLLLIFPTAYFLHLPFTESLFLALVIGSVLAARTGHWATAGIVGALAAFTRTNGALLIPVLAIEAFMQYRATGRRTPAYLWILAVGVGTLGYLGINQYVWGDPLYFQTPLAENWHREATDPITSVSNLIGSTAIFNQPGQAQMYVVQELIFLGVGLLTAIAAAIWSRPSYAVWALLNTWLFASTTFTQSTPRYALTLFPLFLLLAAATRRTWLLMLVSSVSMLWMAWFLGRLATSNWAF